MTRDDLTTLLQRIVDGTAQSSDEARARALAQQDDRLPEDLRMLVLNDADDMADDAAALLALLGHDPDVGLLSNAVRHESGIDIADAVLAAIGSPPPAPVADAVIDEAGPAPELEAPDDGWQPIAATLVDGLVAEARGVDVSARVLAAIGAPMPVSVPQAVRAEAGRVDIAPMVMQTLGVPGLALAQAVRAEAGTVDVAPAVMEALDASWLCGLLDGQLSPQEHHQAAHALMKQPALGRELTELASVGPMLREALAAEAGSVDLWSPVAHAIGVSDPEEVVGWDGSVLAAAVAKEAGSIDVVDAVMRRVDRTEAPIELPVIPQAANSPWSVAGPAVALVAAAAMLLVMVGLPSTSPSTAPMEPLQFASASEVTIEDMSYGDDVFVHVMPAQGDAPLIVWIDEETRL